MPSDQLLLIFGASARAAAFSARRAGLRPWCADLFADADLRACCPVRPVSPPDYPDGFVEVSRQGPPGPWLYTGGLENRPALIRRLSRERPLWGNGAAVLRRVRSPRAVQALLRPAGLPCPAVHFRPEDVPWTGRWLIKPRGGAGGTGVRFWTGAPARRTKPVYFQEFIEGESAAAIYIGDGQRGRLLGVTRQLTGLAWLHARRFAYCGSIGPVTLRPALRSGLEKLGNALAEGTGLRGIFGVDLILQGDTPWPVEVNPRYTASVEVLEHALGLPGLGLHRQVFEPGVVCGGDRTAGPAVAEGTVIGKAILFAPAPVVFPEEGPWSATLERLPLANPWELPAYADIPPAGQRIEAGRPVLTFFARAASEGECLNRLRQIATDLDHRLGKT
jgi:predicted ATP-grasp superfamily ATP-dependent carboligase